MLEIPLTHTYVYFLRLAFISSSLHYLGDQNKFPLQ